MMGFADFRRWIFVEFYKSKSEDSMNPMKKVKKF